MFTHQNQIIRCRGNFTPLPTFPQSDLGRRADSRWALPQISSLFIFFSTRDLRDASADRHKILHGGQ